MWMQPVTRPQSLSASADYKTMLNGTKHAQTIVQPIIIIRYNQNGAVISIILGGLEL